MFEMQPVAYIHNDFPEKFGIPRQSGLLREMESRITFEKAYASFDAIRGIEGFSYLWLIWVFSGNMDRDTRPSLTVRPPRLGGNTRMGVFATRSPFRPNPIGLSCVRLQRIEKDEKGAPVLIVGGADLMDGTPILDIKPYVPYADAHPDALGGFSRDEDAHVLPVQWLCPVPQEVAGEKRAALEKVLAFDPRPSYHTDERIYGISFAAYNIHFRVTEGTLYVVDVQQRPDT